MSQVLEKPILLDETGQAIAGKLDTNSAAIVSKLNDIKDAIGTSSEFIPISIRVIAPPTKVTYKVGERLDLTGMVVNLIGSNGVQVDVTSACTCNPANGTVLTTSDTAVAISYTYQHEATTFTTSQTLTIRALDSIAVTTPPIKTAYQTGETLDLTGIVVTATYSDGYTANVTADCIFSPANGTVLSSSDTSVGINYTEGSVTKSTTIAIGVKELVSIAVTHLPIKTAYHAGEILDLTGLVVTATYDDSSTVDVTNNCTYSPDDGDTLSASDTSVSISYTEGTTTKTTSQVITVIELLSIAITTAPTETEYTVGDTLDLTGIEVTATYSDNSTADVTSACTFSPVDGTTLTTSDTTVTATYTEYGTTKTATQAIIVKSPVYGVEWDGTSTENWSRTDDAAQFVNPSPYYSSINPSYIQSPFDNIQPWAGMQIVNDSNAGSLVSIPKFYYKLTKNGSAVKIQITSTPQTGFSCSPAHMDRGDGQGERDVIYVGRYHCGETYYKSETGVKPANMSRPNLRTAIHNLGSDIWMIDFATIFTIWLLYLVEYANWNSQKKIGYGCGSSNLGRENMGYTDSMPFHTGTNQYVRTDYGLGTQYRYIEGLWDNSQDWIDGCYYDSSSNLCVILNPSNASDTTGGVSLGVPTQSGYPTSLDVVDISGAFPAFIFKGQTNGTVTKPITDTWFRGGSSSPCLKIGGYPASEQGFGLFCGNYGGTTETGGTSSRIMKLPSNS